MEMGADTEEAGAETVDAAAVECTAADVAAAVDAGDCCTRRGSGGGGGAADETGAGAVDAAAAAAAARLCGLSACRSTSASGWTVWRGRSGRGGAVLTFDLTTPMPLPAPNRPPTGAAAFVCIGPESVRPLAVAAEFVRAPRAEIPTPSVRDQLDVSGALPPLLAAEWNAALLWGRDRPSGRLSGWLSPALPLAPS